MTQNLRHLAETLTVPQRRSALIFDPRAMARTLQIAGLVASISILNLLCSDLAGGCDSTCRRRGNGALRIAACARACARKHDSNGGPFHRIALAAARRINEPSAQIPLTVSKQSHNTAADIDSPRTHAAVMAQGSACRTPCHRGLVVAASAQHDVSRLCSMLQSMSSASARQV